MLKGFLVKKSEKGIVCLFWWKYFSTFYQQTKLLLNLTFSKKFFHLLWSLSPVDGKNYIYKANNYNWHTFPQLGSGYADLYAPGNHDCPSDDKWYETSTGRSGHEAQPFFYTKFLFFYTKIFAFFTSIFWVFLHQHFCFFYTKKFIFRPFFKPNFEI